MFKSLVEVLHIRLVKYQLKVFLNWRKKRGLSVFRDQHEEWIRLFYDKLKIDDVLDITETDIERFVKYVGETYCTKWETIAAETAVRQFVKFYSARGKMGGAIADYNKLRYSHGVMFLADTKRNKELVLRRLKDPQKWSWRRLGQQYGLHHTTAKQIFTRDLNKYATDHQVHHYNNYMSRYNRVGELSTVA